MTTTKLNLDEVLDRIETLRSMGSHLSLGSLRKGMFATQTRCKWTRVEDVVRMFRRVPLLHEVGGRESKASVPRSLVNLTKGMLKLNAVDEKGRFKTKGEFRVTGFRRLSYLHLGRLTGFGRSTVALNISRLKDAGLIDAFQEENLDGSKGAWWVRFNPFTYQIWVLRLKAKSQGLMLDIPSARAEKVASPSPNGRTLLSSIKPEQASAVAVAVAVAGKKEMESPRGADSFSKKADDRISEARLAGYLAANARSEPPSVSSPSAKSTATNPISATATDSQSTLHPGEFEQFARQEILKTETGEIAKILEPAIPDIPAADATLLQKLHNLVHHAVPMLRLDRTMAELLVNTMFGDPEPLGAFAKMGVQTCDGHDSPKLDFLLKFWPGICKRLWATRLFQHDVNQDHHKAALHCLKATLFEPVNARELSEVHRKNPGDYWVRCLALALTRKWTTPVVAAIAEKARGYLLHASITYAVFRKRFPQIIRLCRVPEHCDKKLLEQATRTTSELAAWDEIKLFYGFERYDPVW